MLNKKDVEIYKESKNISRECFETGLFKIGEKIEIINERHLKKFVVKKGEKYVLKNLPRLQKEVVEKINKNYKGFGIQYSFENENYIGVFQGLRVDTKVIENQYRYDVDVIKIGGRRVS